MLSWPVLSPNFRVSKHNTPIRTSHVPKKQASASNSVQGSRNWDTSDGGETGGDAGSRPRQHGDKSSGGSASGSERSGGAREQSRSGAQREQRQAARPGAANSVSPPGGSFISADVGSGGGRGSRSGSGGGSGSGSGSGGSGSDGATVGSDGAVVPGKVSERGGAAAAAGSGGRGVPGAIPPTPAADGGNSEALSSPSLPPSARPQGSATPADKSGPPSPLLPGADAERGVGGGEEAGPPGDGDVREREGGERQGRQWSSSSPKVR